MKFSKRLSIISLETNCPFVWNPSLKSHSGVWACQTKVCPLKGILFSSQKRRVALVPSLKATWGFTLSPTAWLACWLRIESGLSSFSGVILLKCCFIKSVP